mgnify:CR=1 FL=1
MNLSTCPKGSIPLYSGLVPILTVLGLELVLSGASLRSIKLRKLLCGKPVILIENGKMIQENLRKTRVTLDELSGHLREKDVLDISQVQYAILETNGNLSVFPYPAHKPASAKDAGIQPKRQYLPVTIISDGNLLHENLQKLGKDEAWVHRVLAERKATVASTWLLTADDADRIEVAVGYCVECIERCAGSSDIEDFACVVLDLAPSIDRSFGVWCTI